MILSCVSEVCKSKKLNKVFQIQIFPEAKAMAEKQMNELKGQIEGKCVVQ